MSRYHLHTFSSGCLERQCISRVSLRVQTAVQRLHAYFPGKCTQQWFRTLQTIFPQRRHFLRSSREFTFSNICAIRYVFSSGSVTGENDRDTGTYTQGSGWLAVFEDVICVFLFFFRLRGGAKDLCFDVGFRHFLSEYFFNVVQLLSEFFLLM